MEQQKPHSHHVFLFPFRVLEPLTFDAPWVPETYEPHRLQTHYNQHSYFYDFAEMVMFNLAKESAQNSRPFFQRFTYNFQNQPATYHIQLKDFAEPFVLNITELRVHYLAAFGVGVMAFFLENYQTNAPDDIIRINEFGRRIYPQFLPLEVATSHFLAKEITVSFGSVHIAEKFVNDANADHLSKAIPKHISYFITDKVRPIIDDRMFVCCAYQHQELASQEAARLRTTDDTPKQVSFWYRFLTSETATDLQHDPLFLEEQLAGATHRRWLAYNTIYGVTRHSLLLLQGEGQVGNRTDNTFLTLYVEMAILCLLQRACLLKFGYQASTISAHIEAEDVQKLYGNYIEFRNRVFFREITAQEQGIELYDLLQRQMRLESELKELDEDISEINNYVNMKEQAELAREQGELSVIASYFLPSTLVAAVMAFFSDKEIFSISCVWCGADQKLNLWVFILLIPVIITLLTGKQIISGIKRIIDKISG